ncbi:hypothetical protein PV332_14545 [Streptomyces scabiei]|uniref:hypothetical protein n=1 Tax=Streptomyces scabiei TaxID=1930 RepID=UPI0029A26254|nr:hypothetical protein [Streptomyces scabiei]MDX2576689.1 hypothetical protein [Streptomyces scabiei]MDX3027629.1 hypothetical protein [Streptomyces scabiei]MDX3206296.1 hypothetical protein [Streptomyces scabiei]
MPNALPPQGFKPRRPARRYNDLEAEFAKFTDPRIAPVLHGLQEAEAALALDWAYAGGSWAESAAAVGLAPAVGERVRRKLKRLGTRYTERCSAARAFTAVHRAAVDGVQEVLG